jgi:hypothetical protein
MIRKPHLQQTVTRPHAWLNLTNLESPQREFECAWCHRMYYVQFGTEDELDDEHQLLPEIGGNCRQWQAR